MSRASHGQVVDRLRRLAARVANTPLHPQWFSFDAKRRAADQAIAAAAGRVLDIGCGEAGLRARMPADVSYVGLDYPVTGRDWYGATPDVFADAARLPFGDRRFERVWLLDVLEHLADPDASLREAARVLAPGGTLLVAVPFMYPLHDEPRDFQRLTEHGLRRSLAAAGLEAIQVAPRGAPAETAALAANIALARLLARGVRAFAPAVLLAVVLFPVVLAINLLGWCFGRLSGRDGLMPVAYLASARKPAEGPG